jgi:uncharacterized protein YggU (UPF0235/DUF167 family)
VRASGVPIIQVRVRPGARSSSFEPAGDGTYLAQVKAPPVEGKANAELIALVARHFRCAKSAVSLKAGGSGRIKLVVVPEQP